MAGIIGKWGLFAAAVVLVLGGVSAAGDATDGADGAGKARVLIVYFSHTNTTRGIAERLQNKLGADLYRIEPVAAYPEEYQAVLAQARKEIDAGFKPELKGELPSLENVDLLLIGGPVWCGTMAPPLASFLAQVDLKGKTIAPFCTYGGGIQDYFKHVAAAVSEEATVTDGLGLSREQLKKTDAEIDQAVADWSTSLAAPSRE